MAGSFARVDQRLTGWVESRSQSTRKQSIKQVISKLHQLSNGLFGRGMIDKYQRPKAITERNSSSRLNKSQTLIASSAAPSSRLTLIKMRHTSSSVYQEVQQEEQQNKELHSKRLQDIFQSEEPLSVHCLKIRNFQIPPTKIRDRHNKIIRRKVEDDSQMRRTHYQLKRSQHYRRRPPEPEKKDSEGLRDSIIKLMEDNLRIKSIGSRTSRLD